MIRKRGAVIAVNISQRAGFVLQSHSGGFSKIITRIGEVHILIIETDGVVAVGKNRLKCDARRVIGKNPVRTVRPRDNQFAVSRLAPRLIKHSSAGIGRDKVVPKRCNQRSRLYRNGNRLVGIYISRVAKGQIPIGANHNRRVFRAIKRKIKIN